MLGLKGVGGAQGRESLTSRLAGLDACAERATSISLCKGDVRDFSSSVLWGDGTELSSEGGFLETQGKE